MSFSISQVQFTQRELQYYRTEFDSLLVAQHRTDGSLTATQMQAFLMNLKLSDHDIKKVLTLTSEPGSKFYLNNFMACMRVCSVIKQGKRYTQEDIKKEQKVLVRKARTSSSPKAPVASVILKRIPSKITVGGPILVECGWFGSSSYHKYRIFSEILNQCYEVTRRFSDLEWLYKTLNSQFKGYIIPQLPDKKLINNHDKSFLEQRRVDIEKFLICIIDNEEIAQSSYFLGFLTMKEEEFGEMKDRGCVENQGRVERKGLEDTIDFTIASVKTKFQFITSQMIETIDHSTQEIKNENLNKSIKSQALMDAHQALLKSENLTTAAFSEVLCIGDEYKSGIVENRAIYNSLHTQLYEFLKAESLKFKGLANAIVVYEEVVAKKATEQNLMDIRELKFKNSSDHEKQARYKNELAQHQFQIEELEKQTNQIQQNIANNFQETCKHREQSMGSLITSMVTGNLLYYNKELEELSKLINKLK